MSLRSKGSLSFMNDIEIGSLAINEVCQALSLGDIEKGREIIQKNIHTKSL